MIYCLENVDVSNTAFQEYVDWYIKNVESRRATGTMADTVNTVIGTVGVITAEEMAELEKGETPILGNKGSFGPKFKKKTREQIHAMHGHISFLLGCRICEALRRTTRRAYAEVDRFKELQPGDTWTLDCAVHKATSKDGENHFAIVRDVRTGYFAGFGLERKSDMTVRLVELIEGIRQKFGPDHAHVLFRTLLLDNAGEQQHNNAEFNQAKNSITGGSVETIYSDPSREKSKSAAELAVKALELRCKGIMLEQSLPVTWWKLAYIEAMEISNMYSLTRNVNSRDGDAVRPLEELSKGRISRQFINKILKYFVLLGTPARISTNKIKGSDIANAARERWGIAYGRVNDVPIWLDPFEKGVTFMSKDYIVHELGSGESFFDFFNLPLPAPKVMIHDPDRGVPAANVDTAEADTAVVIPSHGETMQISFDDIEKVSQAAATA